MHGVVQEGSLVLHGSMRTPSPHQRLQSSRPRIYTVVLLGGGGGSSVRTTSIAFHLARALLASALLAWAFIASSLLASARLIARGGEAEHWRQRELFNSHSRCRSGSARCAAVDWPQRQVFDSHLLVRESAAATRNIRTLPISAARTALQAIALAMLGRGGERSANATLITWCSQQLGDLRPAALHRKHFASTRNFRTSGHP